MFRNLTIFAILLALFVVVLGAYVRLSDAGLGCPDWPGCYGSLIVDESHEGVSYVSRGAWNVDSNFVG